MSGPGQLARVSTYVHDGCPSAFVTAAPRVETTAPRVEVAAGRLACSACGAWWDSLNVGQPPDGATPSDLGTHTTRSTP